MNIDYTEVPYTVIAKMCSYGRSTRKVTYLFLDTYHSLCMDKKDILSSQLEACERLLKYATEEIDRQTIEKEISGLKTTLDLIS